jgi:hypothetical protein
MKPSIVTLGGYALLELGYAVAGATMPAALRLAVLGVAVCVLAWWVVGFRARRSPA